MKHCCVIGGGGFIGGYIVEKLITRQRRVTIIDKNPAPSRPQIAAAGASLPAISAAFSPFPTFT